MDATRGRAANLDHLGGAIIRPSWRRRVRLSDGILRNGKQTRRGDEGERLQTMVKVLSVDDLARSSHDLAGEVLEAVGRGHIDDEVDRSQSEPIQSIEPEEWIAA